LKFTKSPPKKKMHTPEEHTLCGGCST